MKDKSFAKNYAKYYDLFNEGKDYKKECDFLKEVFSKYRKGKVKDILDLGCGTGAHDAILASRGYNVTGLDLSEEMINIAKSKNIPSTNFVAGDMSKFKLGKKYDSCIAMFAAFGYQIHNKQITSSLQCINNHLRPGGLFIIDCWNGLGVLREPPTRRIKEVKRGGLKIVRESFPKLNSYNHFCEVKFKVNVFENNRLEDSFEETHKIRFLFPQELRKYLEDEGFEVLEICKQFKMGTKLTEKDWNLSLIARLK